MKEKDIDKHFEELIEESQDTDKRIEESLGKSSYTDYLANQENIPDKEYNEELLMELYEKETGKSAITSRKTVKQNYLKWKEE